MDARAWTWQHYVILEMKWGVREACQLSAQVPVGSEVRQSGGHTAPNSRVSL